MKDELEACNRRLVIDGNKLIASRELWRRVFCQYKRQRLVEELRRFAPGYPKHDQLKAGLDAYDAETLRLCQEAGVVSDIVLTRIRDLGSRRVVKQ